MVCCGKVWLVWARQVRLGMESSGGERLGEAGRGSYGGVWLGLVRSETHGVARLATHGMVRLGGYDPAWSA